MKKIISTIILYINYHALFNSKQLSMVVYTLAA